MIQAQWSRQKVIERRIKAYDELAQPLNQLFCFFCYVGSWKELDPPALVKLKRQLDQTAHTSAPPFDQLRTLPDRRQEVAGKEWRADWDRCFAGRDEASEPSEVKTAYGELMAYLAGAIGAVGVDAHLLGSAKIPGNFDSRAAGMVSARQTLPGPLPLPL